MCRAGVLLDSPQILMYLVPPGQLAQKLAPGEEAEGSMIGVSITTKKPQVWVCESMTLVWVCDTHASVWVCVTHVMSESSMNLSLGCLHVHLAQIVMQLIRKPCISWFLLRSVHVFQMLHAEHWRVVTRAGKKLSKPYNGQNEKF